MMRAVYEMARGAVGVRACARVAAWAFVNYCICYYYYILLLTHEFGCNVGNSLIS